MIVGTPAFHGTGLLSGRVFQSTSTPAWLNFTTFANLVRTSRNKDWLCEGGSAAPTRVKGGMRTCTEPSPNAAASKPRLGRWRALSLATRLLSELEPGHHFKSLCRTTHVVVPLLSDGSHTVCTDAASSSQPGRNDARNWRYFEPAV